MPRAHTTEYGKVVKIELIKRDWTLTQLASLVANDTGQFCDRKYLSAILRGKRNPPVIIASIDKILQIDSNTMRVQ